MEDLNFLIVYHANCNDGLMSAAIAKKALADHGVHLSFHPLNYGHKAAEELLALASITQWDHIFFLDIAVAPQYLERLKPCSSLITIIDHHDDALRGEVKDYIATADPVIFQLIFDPSHAGCVLTWNYFFPSSAPVPYKVLLIEDRDLWNWKYAEDTKALQLYISTQPRDLSTFEKLLIVPLEDLKRMLRIGYCIDSYETQAINSIIRNHWKFHPLGAIVNCPAQFVSEAGNLLTTPTSFPYNVACMFEVLDDHIKLSFRSKNGEAQKFAEHFGGGGHPNAAGATWTNGFVTFEMRLQEFSDIFFHEGE